MCKKYLKEPGAILLAPPEKMQHDDEIYYANMVQKYHVCSDCWQDLMGYIQLK